MKRNALLLLLLLASGHSVELNAVLDKPLLDPRSQVTAGLIIQDVKKIKEHYQALAAKHNIKGIAFCKSILFDTSRCADSCSYRFEKEACDGYRHNVIEKGRYIEISIPVSLVTPLGTVRLLEEYPPALSCPEAWAKLIQEFACDVSFFKPAVPLLRIFDTFKGDDASVQLQFCREYNTSFQDLKQKFQNDLQKPVIKEQYHGRDHDIIDLGSVDQSNHQQPQKKDDE